MSGGRFNTLYSSSFRNPYGDDGSYHDFYKNKRKIEQRFASMDAAFASANSNGSGDGNVTMEEMQFLLCMSFLDSENATSVCENLERKTPSRDGKRPRFPYALVVKRVKNADYKQLERIPESLTKALPREVLQAAENQEDLIQVNGLDTAYAFMMMNRAFVCFDKKQTGLVSKHAIQFALRMMGLHKGRVRYATARCDHNTAGRHIAYVEFIRELQGIDFAGETFGRTFGAQPRSPHRNIKPAIRDLADANTGVLDDTMEELLDMQ
jgi:hypothetical protein